MPTWSAGRKDAGQKPAPILACLRPHPVVAGDRVLPGEKRAQPEDDLAREWPGHRHPGMAVAYRPVWLHRQRAAGEIAADQARRKGAVPLVHRAGVDDGFDSAAAAAHIRRYLGAAGLIDDLVAAADKHQERRPGGAAVGKARDAGSIKRDMAG